MNGIGGAGEDARPVVESELDAETWVVTGAAGRVATALRPALAERVGLLRLVDRVPVKPSGPREEAMTADLRDATAMERPSGAPPASCTSAGWRTRRTSTTWPR